MKNFLFSFNFSQLGALEYVLCCSDHSDHNRESLILLLCVRPAAPTHIAVADGKWTTIAISPPVPVIGNWKKNCRCGSDSEKSVMKYNDSDKLCFVLLRYCSLCIAKVEVQNKLWGSSLVCILNIAAKAYGIECLV
jgi:hypothetical protein